MSNKGFCKRIIPCLDVSHGRTVKGVQFSNLRDVGDPVELAERYQAQGADEIMFLDISATTEGRETMRDMVQSIAKKLSIPFSVGGGISTIDHAKRLLEAGADKVSINSAAVSNPQLISDIAEAFGSQCCVLAIDARKAGSETWTVLTHGGKKDAELDGLQWAKDAVTRGAGEILLTSWDKDGTRDGYDIELTKSFSSAVSVPVIASGGASGPDSFVDIFTTGMADAALAASIFHDGQWTVANLKQSISEKGITVRQ